MKRKQLVLSIIAMVIVTWLLISSLSSINNLQPSGSGSHTGTSGNGGGSSNNGNGGSLGSGSGAGGILGSQLFNFNLPSFNFNLDFLQFPKLVLPFPNFGFPTIHFPAIGSLNQLFQKTFGGGGASSSTKSTLTKIVPIIINTYFLIILFSIIGAFMVFVALRTHTKTKHGKAKQEVRKKVDADNSLYKSLKEELEFGELNLGEKALFNYEIEKIPYNGWGGEGIIRPHIASDLPLTWDVRNNLEIDRDEGTIMKMNDDIIESDILNLNLGSNMISAVSDHNSQKLKILGVNYEEHVRDTAIINIPEEFVKKSNSYTLKEIYNMKEISEIFATDQRLDKALMTFERAYYGKKSINRDEYETFLRCIKNDLKKPYIAWAVMNNGRK